MKSIQTKNISPIFAGICVLALCFSMLAAPALAQPGYYRPYGRPYYPPPHRHYNDFDRALAVVGTVGAVAAVAHARRGYYPPHYYYPRPVVVAPARPMVVVTNPRPVIVEKQVVVERPVVVEREVPSVTGTEAYSPKLGASFRMENIQIPGYRFLAARLTSDPVQGSPLQRIGLQKGDVVTRINEIPVNTLSELDNHNGNVQIRYIKTGTTTVLRTVVNVPRNGVFEENVFHAP